ncbi:PPC domain-containing DNA-binding protein [Veillonella criceti]|uniref:Predicted DNA-binding protein with PD1-like DNA-binding motif n=1 Tax=Veillonella criceti TaxID=103891 RepID=A0A380NM28_9FIRM|nr:PPC domain-containing DNA-binding protein [Veillonella criceti]SUP43043.1 Predicted DNA-binding protein with PD1-like DNA-binding motif [Veillonella criceti]
MQYKRLGTTHIAFRLNPGEELVESIEKIAREANITTAMIQGLGATNDIVLETYRASEKKYYHHRLTGDFEITSITGTIDLLNNDYYSHLHITIADQEGHSHGGHLTSAIISVTAEMILTLLPEDIHRDYDEEAELNLWQLDE